MEEFIKRFVRKTGESVKVVTKIVNEKKDSVSAPVGLLAETLSLDYCYTLPHDPSKSNKCTRKVGAFAHYDYFFLC